MIKLVIGTANAAFADGDKNSEVARIIDDAADRIQRESFQSKYFDSKVFDVNGNAVGRIMESNDPFELELNEAYVTLEINTDNAAFEDCGKGFECARILREAAGKIRGGDLSFKLRDVNGNTVGKVEEVGGVEVAAGEQKFELLKLYARKEPTTDSVAIEHGLAEKKDTVFYRDAECTDAAGRYSWHLSNCPRRGQDMAMLNCYKWKLEWLDDLEVSREPVDMDAPGALRHVYKHVGSLVEGNKPSENVGDWEKIGSYKDGCVADIQAKQLCDQGHFSKILSVGEYSPEIRHVLNHYSPSETAYSKAHPEPLQQRYAVMLILESGKKVDFFDFADDANHAEGLAIAAQPEQVFEIVSTKEASVYDELKAAGVSIGSHESDLYVPVTAETTAILANYPLSKSNATTFKSNTDGARTYDIPFAYSPFWEKKANDGSLFEAYRISHEKESRVMADPAVDQNYDGKVMGVTAKHVVLSLGRTALIVAQADLDRIPAQGEAVVVKFKDGKGVVEPTKGKEVDQGR